MIEFRVDVSSEDEELVSIPLSFDRFAELLYELDDKPDNRDVFDLLARHSSQRIRLDIARKANLSPESFDALSRDSCIDVLENLVQSDAFRELATLEQLERMINASPEVARQIACALGYFPRCSEEGLLEFLLRTDDPQVLEGLAESVKTPEEVLESLSEHPDPGVVAMARQNLAYRNRNASAEGGAT